ncbi:MAG: electron transport complex subunit RsxA [Pseudomonadota bacterium]
MQEWLLILVSTVLVNNFVLARFLGLCPFLGATQQIETATGISIATAFVLTLSAGSAYLLEHWVLIPLDLTYLRTLTFILVIASLVQFTELTIRRVSPVLEQTLGIYLPLITTNCAVLGVALLNLQTADSFIEALWYGFGAAIGFGLVTLMFAAIRDRIETPLIPVPLRGAAIALITAGIMSLAFMGFKGMGQIG